jgi:hypothetical protein
MITRDTKQDKALLDIYMRIRQLIISPFTPLPLSPRPSGERGRVRGCGACGASMKRIEFKESAAR